MARGRKVRRGGKSRRRVRIHRRRRVGRRRAIASGVTPENLYPYGVASSVLP